MTRLDNTSDLEDEPQPRNNNKPSSKGKYPELYFLDMKANPTLDVSDLAAEDLMNPQEYSNLNKHHRKEAQDYEPIYRRVLGDNERWRNHIVYYTMYDNIFPKEGFVLPKNGMKFKDIVGFNKLKKLKARYEQVEENDKPFDTEDEEDWLEVFGRDGTNRTSRRNGDNTLIGWVKQGDWMGKVWDDQMEEDSDYEEAPLKLPPSKKKTPSRVVGINSLAEEFDD